MNYRTLLIVTMALVFGLSAAIGVNLLVKQRTGGEAMETVPVVVAATDVPRGVSIAPNQIKTRDWPKHLVPSGALTSVEEARGRVTFHPIVKGEVVLEGKLTGKDSGRGLASMIPPGMRAFTIHTPSVASGVAGFILPGNKVDVLLTLPGDSTTGGGITTTLLQNLEILAVDQRLDPPSENRVDYRQLQSVTLLVTPDQAAKLDLGQNRGLLHLALRNPEDVSAAKTRPATLTDLQFYQEKPSELQVVKSEEARVTPPPAEPLPPPAPAPLEIRTLRGMYHGVILID